jgi:hypothetical protein
LPGYAVLCSLAATILLNLSFACAQTALPAAVGRKTFHVSSGTLSLSQGFVQFDSSEKDISKAEEKSWAASCDQITRWKASGSQDVEIWIQRGNAKEFRPSIRTDGKQTQGEIVDAIRATCGKAGGA